MSRPSTSPVPATAASPRALDHRLAPPSFASRYTRASWLSATRQTLFRVH